MILILIPNKMFYIFQGSQFFISKRMGNWDWIHFQWAHYSPAKPISEVVVEPQLLQSQAQTRWKFPGCISNVQASDCGRRSHFQCSHIAVKSKLQANHPSNSIGWCSSIWFQRGSKTPKRRPFFCFSTEQWKSQRQHWFVSPMIFWIFWTSSKSGMESLNLSFKGILSTSSSTISSLTSSFEGVVSKEVLRQLLRSLSGLGKAPAEASDEMMVPAETSAAAACSAALFLTAGSAALLSFRRSRLGVALVNFLTGVLHLANTLLCWLKDSSRFTISFPFAVDTVSLEVLPALKFLSKAQRAFLALSTPAISNWCIWIKDFLCSCNKEVLSRSSLSPTFFRHARVSSTYPCMSVRPSVGRWYFRLSNRSASLVALREKLKREDPIIFSLFNFGSGCFWPKKTFLTNIFLGPKKLFDPTNFFD